MEGDPNGEVTTTFVRFVTPKYLETMGVKLRDGRMFTEADRTSAGTTPGIIVNEALVKKYFPGTNRSGAAYRPGSPIR